MRKYLKKIGSLEEIKGILAYGILNTQYDNKPLEDALKHLFGVKKIGDRRTRIVIPSFNALTVKVHVYKSRHHKRFERDYKLYAYEAALATAAAPIYFPVYKNDAGLPLIDAGIYSNNPMGLTMIEATSVLEWKSNDIKLVSIGCTESPFDMSIRISPNVGANRYALDDIGGIEDLIALGISYG